ncbi:DDE-type integrase/transposase/recombinase [Corynebacterium diphtheriae]|uniref:DDE-type integrase/transposase/recombinase n=1 Tax=Corynebacterium diphtheriae TaxID=1717 RepID=UPI000934BB0F
MSCRNGFTMYLATVIDLCLRKFAGFVIADHMRSSLVIEALDHANTVRGGLDGAIFHSDHGSVGGFNWLSQHPEHGGVRRWLPRTGVRRPVICRWGCGVSGVRIGRCGLRCVPRVGRFRHGRCNASSGV